MSRLIGLVMDIISGTHRMVNRQEDGTVFVGESLTEDELEKLQLALKILSDAERQIRSSSERSTCFTAALLQLCSVHNQETAIASSSSKQLNKYSTKKALENSLLEGNFSTSLILSASGAKVKPGHVTLGVLPRNASVDRTLVDGMRKEDDTGKRSFLCVDPFKLDEIWTRCIKKSQSEPLRQLLTHGKLVSITETEGKAQYIAQPIWCKSI
ncbi:protein STICHEL-like 1 [Typha angustifolia]|uniref:protein STICHEL-like 1 n=1 Tax=Typha angustifolia TaxID=59011 RepID=UPI003C2F1718